MSLPIDNRRILVDALAHILRPVARLCIRRSIKFQEALQIFKRAFVQAAQEELARNHAKESVSKLSIMTGLQRPDVSSNLKDSKTVREPSILARVIGNWSTNRKFLDGTGNPRPLSFEGKESEFAKLVATISKELNFYAVLFDLERLHLVEKDGSQLKLLSNIYVQSEDLADALRLLGNDLSDLVDAVEANAFEKPEVPNLHLKVFYDNIDPKEIPALRKWVLKEGSAFAAHAQQHISRFDADINPDLPKPKKGAKISLGLFGFAIDENAEKIPPSKE